MIIAWVRYLVIMYAVVRKWACDRKIQRSGPNVCSLGAGTLLEFQGNLFQPLKNLLLPLLT